MCSCDWNFVCSRCAGTPFDPNYEADAPEPLDLAEWDRLTTTGRPADDEWPQRFWG